MNYPTLSQGARLTAVRLKNAMGEEIGKVVEWFMDIEQGRVVYVVCTFHNREDYYAIPWPLLKADKQNGGYVVDQQDVEKHDLRVQRDSINDLIEDKAFLGKVFEIYNLPAYGTPASAEEKERLKAGKGEVFQSNASLGEGKGYGG